MSYTEFFGFSTFLTYVSARVSNTRAARRAASPIDRSLDAAPRVEEEVERPSVLAERRSSGIQKKQAQKKLSRAQRLRQQKGMDRAEAVLDQLQIKKAKSLTRGKVVKARSVWISNELSAFGIFVLTEDPAL